MPVFKDICRICLQGADYQDIQEIDIRKLNNLKNKPFSNISPIPKWEIEFFQNHVICNTCIHNFRTIKTVYRQGLKVNNAISMEKNKHQLSKVNLKRLNRFSHIEGDFIVCRLCLEPNRQIAVYLYDNSKNILPVEYIAKMLKYIKVYMNFDKTVNPVLCQTCWQNVQISYSFCKHLELVTEKMLYYQAMVDKIYLDHEDLQKVLEMWDHLGIANVKTEKNIQVKNEIKIKINPEYHEINSPITTSKILPRIKKNIASIKQGYSFYHDHDYLKLDTEVGHMSYADIADENTSEMPKLSPNVENENVNEMPKLKLIGENNIDEKKICDRQLTVRIPLMTGKQQKQIIQSKSTTNKRKIVEQHELKNIEEEERLRVINKYEKAIMILQNEHYSNLNNTPYREKLKLKKNEELLSPNMTSNKEQGKDAVKKRSMNQIIQNKQEETDDSEKTKNKEQIKTSVKKRKLNQNKEETKPDSTPSSPKITGLVKVLSVDILRPRTRLSTKQEVTKDLFPSKDLLVLQKEEIIKGKRRTRKSKISLPKSTSTPIATKNPNVENLPSKSILNTEYNFEKINLSQEVPKEVPREIQVKKEVIEEEELQIKREILSETESDDNFTEHTGCNTNINNDFDDECPNLESFIKSEPPEDSYVMDLDEDEPPELEFQGPCVSVPIPFTIQSTYTVDEKQQLVNNVDEKKILLDSLGEKTLPEKNTVNEARNVNNSVAVDTKNASTSSDVKRNSTSIIPQKNRSAQEATSILPKVASSNTVVKRDSSRIKQDLRQLVRDKIRNILYRVPLANTVEKSASPRPDKMPSLVMETTEFNTKLYPALEKTPKSPSTVSASNFCGELQVNKRVDSNTELKSTLQNTPSVSAASTSNSKTEKQANTNPYDIMEINRKTVNTKKPFFCRACDFTSKSVGESINHIALHKANLLNLHKCEFCPYASSNEAYLTRHMKQVHQKAIPETTKLGPFSSSIKEDLNKHVKSTREVFVCTFCPFRTMVKKTMEGHVAKKHKDKEAKTYRTKNKPKNFNCAECGGITILIKSCMICNCVFHPKCLLTRKPKSRSNCRHVNAANLAAKKNIAVFSRRSYLLGQKHCNYCGVDLKNWISCEICKQSFHYDCFEEDSVEPTSNCKHASLRYLYPCRIAESGEESSGNPLLASKVEPATCDFCQKLIKIRIVCWECNNYMHKDCLKKHQCYRKDVKAGPEPVLESAVKRRLRRIILKPTPPNCCEYCKQPVGKNGGVICKNCNRLLHDSCLILDRNKRVFDCEHLGGEISPPYEVITPINTQTVVQVPPFSRCAYCQAAFGMRNLVTCKKCKVLLHQSCWMSDRPKQLVKCEHILESTLSPLSKNTYTVMQDQSACADSLETETTSKELKQEMLDESQL